jgi:hypothetical protein
MPHTYTKKQLLQLCRLYKWNHYSNLNKADLLEFVQHKLHTYTSAAVKIQRYFRTFISRLRKYTLINNDDFITLEPLTPPCIFHLRNIKTGHIYQFNPKSLLVYILKSGKFVNPFTRLPISDLNLRRLRTCFLQKCKDALTFEVHNNVYIINQHSDLIRIKHVLARAREQEREQAATVQLLRNNCLQLLEMIVECLCAMSPLDIESIRSDLSLITEVYFMRFVEDLENMALINRPECQIFMQTVIFNFCEFSERSPSEFLCSMVSNVCQLFLNQYNLMFDSTD